MFFVYYLDVVLLTGGMAELAEFTPSHTQGRLQGTERTKFRRVKALRNAGNSARRGDLCVLNSL
jgi:hypothetical protein